MTEAWRRVSLSDLAEVATGKGIRREERLEDGPVPIFGANGVIGYTVEPLLAEPAVIVGRVGAYGAVNLAPIGSWVSDNALICCPRQDVPLKFLQALLETVDYDRLVHGTTQPLITQSGLRSYEVLVPPPDEQWRLAEVLGALDDRIETLSRSERLLLDFGLTQLEVALESTETRPMRVDEIATFENRKRIPLSQMERDKRPGPYPYYGATGIFGYVDDYLFDGFRVLVGEDGSVIEDDGTPVLQLAHGKYWVNNHAHVLAGRAVATEALWFLLRNLAVDPAVTGAVQPKLSMGRLAALEVLVPSEASSFFAVAKECIAQVLHRREQLRDMIEARDFLIPRLVSGELRVAAAEELVEAAT